MDAVISIGGQSFLDGLVRILGPALQPLRAPMPIALPGLTNGVLSIRNVQPVLPGAHSGSIELDVEFELKGEVLLVASVAAGTVNLALGNGTINLQPSTGSVAEQARAGTLTTNPGTGTETGTIAGVATTLTMAINPLTGSVQLPAATAPLTLGAIVGTLQLPAGVGNLTLPLPAVAPTAVDFTKIEPLIARIFLTPNLNGLPIGSPSSISAATGFGLEFGFETPDVEVSVPSAAFAAALEGVIRAAISSVAGQLLQGLAPLAQPATNLQAVATALAGVIPVAVNSALVSAFTGLRARTGRLTYPAPVPGPPPAPPPSCDVRALPTDAKARLMVAADGSILLQVGFDRSLIRPTDAFPFFAPAGLLDTRVTLTNTFLRDLLVCLIQKFPNLSLPTVPSLTNTPTMRGATWAPVTLTIGPLSLVGSLALTISGRPAGPAAATPAPKTILLTFTLAQAVGAPLVIGSALDIALIFSLPIAFDLSKLASITSLRLTGPPLIASFVFSLGVGLSIMLALAGAAFLAPAFAGVLPIIMPGLAVIGLLIGAGPHIITGIIATLLRNAVTQVLDVVHLLESPVALPPGILDAFGTLVPTTMVVDDLVADGVLQTPTSPWAVLPISVIGSRVPPPPARGRGTGGNPLPPDFPGEPLPVTPPTTHIPGSHQS